MNGPIDFIYTVCIKIRSGYSDALRTGRSEFVSRQGQEMFLYITAYILALGPNQPSIQWVPRALSPEIKRPKCEADHSPVCNVKVKNGGVIPPLPHTSL
jgi:hypothetical protein